MEQIQWNDSMSVGNATIDAQHKQLLTLTNDLVSKIRSGTADSELKETFKTLLKYVKDHFKFEEQQFENKTDPSVQKHMKEHQAFVAYLIQLYGDMENTNEETATHTSEFLNNWIRNHLMGTDQETLHK